MRRFTKLLFISTGTVLIVVGFLMIISHAGVLNWLIDVGEKYLSQDSDISSKIKWRLSLFVYYVAVILLLAGLAIWGLLNGDSFAGFKKAYQESIQPKEIRPGSLLLLSSLIGFFLIILFALFYSGRWPGLAPLYLEDGTAGDLNSCCACFNVDYYVESCFFFKKNPGTFN